MVTDHREKEFEASIVRYLADNGYREIDSKQYDKGTALDIKTPSYFSPESGDLMSISMVFKTDVLNHPDGIFKSGIWKTLERK